MLVVAMVMPGCRWFSQSVVRPAFLSSQVDVSTRPKAVLMLLDHKLLFNLFTAGRLSIPFGSGIFSLSRSHSHLVSIIQVYKLVT